MKKLHILIPSLIATTTIPLVGLVGCNKTNINVDDYKIDEDKFDEIVGMESVDYLQSEFEIKSTIADHQYQHTHLENYYYEMSPTIDHSIKTTDEIGTKETYEEEYVWYTEGEYDKINRYSKDADFSDPSIAAKNDFYTPQDLGSYLITLYEEFEEKPSFDNDKLCYEFAVSWQEDTKRIDYLVDFHFYKNKLVKVYKYYLLKNAEYWTSETTETINFEHKNYVPPLPPVKFTFENDSWKNICDYANQGINKLCEMYELTKEQLIGKERKIAVNGIAHRVRVVGIEEDTISQTNKKATLTFEFVNVICDEDGSAYFLQWNATGNNNNYWTSSIHNSLNDETSSETNSVYEMILAENDWATNIKSIDRKVNEFGSDEEWHAQEGSEKIFLLNLSDIYSQTALEIQYPTLYETYEAENTRGNKQYSFYQQVLGDASPQESHEQLVKVGIEVPVGHFWWLATPDISRDVEAFDIGPYGTIDTSTTGYGCTPAPCFCI